MNFKHKKTGDIYTLIGFALAEKTLKPVVVYRRADGEGPEWTRDANEFFDGRFIPCGEVVPANDAQARYMHAMATTTSRLNDLVEDGKRLGTIPAESVEKLIKEIAAEFWRDALTAPAAADADAGGERKS